MSIRIGNSVVSGSVDGKTGIDRWITTKAYSIGDIVFTDLNANDSNVPVVDEGKIWRCKTANTDASFTNTKWDSLGGGGASLPKEYNETHVNITQSIAGWANYKGFFLPYQTTDGWWLRFHISADITLTNASQSLTINGIAFSSAFKQALKMEPMNTPNIGIAYTNAGTGTVNMSGGWRRNVTLWGDVKLNAKPTWAT